MPAILTLPKNTIICTSVITQRFTQTCLGAIPLLCHTIAGAYLSEFAGIADRYVFTLPTQDRVDPCFRDALQVCMKPYFWGKVTLEWTDDWGPGTYCVYPGADVLPNFAFRIPT